MASLVHALVRGPVDGHLVDRLEREHGVRSADGSSGTTDAAAVDCVIDARPLAGEEPSLTDGPPTVVLHDDGRAATRALADGAARCVRLEGDPRTDAAHVAAAVRRELDEETGGATTAALASEPPRSPVPSAPPAASRGGERDRPAGDTAGPGPLDDRQTLIQEALDELADVFFLFDTDLQFLAWNRTLSEVTGYSDEEVASMVPTDFVADEDEASIAAAISRAIEEGRAIEEATIVTRDGEGIPFEFTGTALTDDDGDVLGICGIGRDITERKRRERTLECQAERLRTLNRINEVIRNVNRDLVRAATREEIERSVVERLAAEEPYRFAWIGEYDAASGRVAPRASAGDGSDYLDVRADFEFESEDMTAETAVRTGEVKVAQRIADNPTIEPWREAALERGYESAAAVPLVYRGATYGAFCVYAPRPDAFDDEEREVLRELGETVAYAINAAERRRALLTDSVVELEFIVRDDSFFPVAASTVGADVEFMGAVPSGDESLAQFYRIEGADPGAVLAGTDATGSVVREREDGGVVRIEGEAGLGAVFADYGGTVLRIHASDGEARVVTTFPQGTDVRRVVEAVERHSADAELVARREREREGATPPGRRADEALTDRQRTVLTTAYLSGFFDSPRANTGAEVAETLDISTPTFHEHIRIAERKLVEAFLEPHVDEG